MSKIAALALCLVYFACVLTGVPFVGPRVSPWFLSVLSAGFVWCYLMFVRGHAGVAVAVVILFTLVFPVGALVFIGWPVYRSWSALAESFWAAAQIRGPMGGVEFLAPTIAAALCAGIVGRLTAQRKVSGVVR
jgi:hypothetical protein